jgi:hypothetical protein
MHQILVYLLVRMTQWLQGLKTRVGDLSASRKLAVATFGKHAPIPSSLADEVKKWALAAPHALDIE